MIRQLKYLSPDDVRMLEQGNEIIQKKISKSEWHKTQNKKIFGYSHLVIRLGSIQEYAKS